jgi:hypothetical protein
MFLDIIHILSFSKITVLFICQNATFRRMDPISIFKQNLLSRAQSIEQVPNTKLNTWITAEFYGSYRKARFRKNV